MARTAIPITSIAPYQVGGKASATAGDTTNDMSVDLSSSPKLILVGRTGSATPITFTIELPAGKQTYNATVSKSITTTQDYIYVWVIDHHPDLAQTGNVLHIDSADANFSNFGFFAYTWAPTQWR